MSNTNIQFKVARFIAAVLMTVTTVSSISAKKNTMSFDGATKSGFNAMDYRLQKPLGNPLFPDDQRGLGRNFFFGFNASGSLLGNNFSNGLKPGAALGIRMGSWFSPVHGIRIGGDAGIHSVHKGIDNTWYAGVHADYLLNLTNLLRGYNPNRRFELIAVMGAQLQRNRQDGIWGTNYGFTASMQTRFNVEPSMYLYLEPQLSLLAGSRYDAPHSNNRFHTDLTLNVGLGYRILTGRLRAEGSSPFRQSDDDNLYFGGGIGAFGMMNVHPKFNNPYLRAYVGKMFSSTSGLQVSAGYGYYRTGYRPNQHLVMGSLDYVLNLNNAFGGYRPNEVFQMILNLGATAATISGTDQRKIYPGVQAGLTGMFRLSSNWGLFIHPQVYGFTESFYKSIGHKRVPIVSVDLGLRYTIGDFSIDHESSRQAYAEDSSHWFITAGGGAYHRLRGNYGNGGNAFIGFGKRFTPVSSWRINFDGAFAKNRPYAESYTLHADYLASLTTSMYGYDPDRLFDLQLMVGGFAGEGTYNGPHKPVVGLEAGLQANFRLNSSLDLFLEPQVLATYGPGYSAMAMIPDLRVQVGLRYKLGTPAGQRGTLANTIYGERRNFVGIAIGASEITTRPSIRRSKTNFNGLFDLSVGRWLSMVSGIRATYSNDILRYDGSSSYIGSMHLDYMLNVTSLMDRRDTRRFHILGVVGAGVSFSDADYTKPSPILTGGVQFRYNLPGNFDIHLEPGLTLWPNRVLPRSYRGHKFVTSPRLSIGTSYRF
ncbi:MAG: hypothetical protein HDR82_03100 [Bacteroides sp.]|nr:hypothetical protein [Bacteroides sp.]